MSSISTPWIKALIARRESRNLKQDYATSEEARAFEKISAKGIEYWKELHSQLEIQGRECVGLGLSVRIKHERDPRSESAQCLIVNAVGDSAAAREASLRLSYMPGERVIILYRKPPHQPFGEEAINIMLALSSQVAIVGYYFNDPLCPYDLAKELLKFLGQSVTLSQSFEDDDQITID